MVIIRHITVNMIAAFYFADHWNTFFLTDWGEVKEHGGRTRIKANMSENNHLQDIIFK